MRTDRRARGSKGEVLAVDFLVKKGYRILERNYRFGRGEIDIIAEENAALVFVEVKARSSKLFGDPVDAVTIHKCNQIRKIARGYLCENHIDERACRFDIVAIDLSGDLPDIRHIENAF